MLITRTSGLTGITRTKDINVTVDQLEAWHAGSLIHIAMPHLTSDEREFIMTGITPEEWNEAFGVEE